MEARDPDYQQAVEAVFTDAQFVADMRILLDGVTPGRCQASVELSDQHRQHLGLVHGGVIMTLAGHAALGAALSIAEAGAPLVLPSYSMNMMRGAKSGKLGAEAIVVKAGAALTFVESEVYAEPDGKRQLLAKGSFTFARTPAK